MNKEKTSKFYQQKFRREWLKIPAFSKWLCEIPTDKSKAHCRYCRCDILAKHSLLVSHCETRKHKTSTPQQIIPFTYTFKIKDKTAVLEATLAMFICCHSSFSSCDHLVDLCKNYVSDSDITSRLEMRREKCANIVRNVLAPYFDEDLASDIGNGKFSLLFDESDDLFTTKLLGIVVVYYSENHQKVVHTYLSILFLETCDADGIVNALKIELEKKKLNIKNLLAIGSDNNSITTGVNNNVFLKLKEDVPSLLLFKCVCHSLQLAVSHACAECLPRNLEFLVSETYKWFSHSLTRQKIYKQVYLAINDKEPLKIVNSCAARWLSVEPAVNRILSEWFELLTHFQTTSVKEKCFLAEKLYEMFCDSKNELFLLFLHPVLKHVQEVNKVFESNTADKTNLFEHLSNLIKCIANMILLPTCLINPLDPDVYIEEFLDPKPNLGHMFERKMTELKIKNILTAAEEKYIRKRAQQFLLSLFNELKERLPTNFKILRNIKYFSVDNVLRHLKEPIFPILDAMHVDEEIIDLIEIQFNNIHLFKWSNISNTEAFWFEVLDYKDSTGENPFKDLAKFVINLLILPSANAEVKELFSIMNTIKSKLKNKMQLPMLGAILSVRYGLKRHGKCCKNFDIPKHIFKKIQALDACKGEDLNTVGEYEQIKCEDVNIADDSVQISEIEEIISQC